MTENEAEYLLNRAREEAAAASRARHPSASAAHQRLSVLYSAKAMMELGQDNDEVGSAPARRN